MRAVRFGWGFALVIGVFAIAAAVPALGQGSFVNFESGHVRPLALSPDGSRLFAVNTPDNRLEIYDVGAGGLSLAAEVPVGLEPVAVASRVNAGGRVEAWVVNHLSDSVSIVEVDPADVPARTSCAPCWSATSRATSSSPAPASTAPSSPPPAAARTCRRRCPPTSPPPGRRARWYGASTPTRRAPPSAARRCR